MALLFNQNEHEINQRFQQDFDTGFLVTSIMRLEVAVQGDMRPCDI